MNSLDLLNIYYNFIFNYNEISYNRAYEDFHTTECLKKWLQSFNINLSFFNQVDNENWQMFKRAKSLKNADFLFKTDYDQEYKSFYQKEIRKYQVAFLPGIGDELSKKIIDRNYALKYQNDSIRVFCIDKLVKNNDFSFYGPFQLFLNALFQIDNWPGIFVFKEHLWNFIPVKDENDIQNVFKRIENHTIFDDFNFNHNDGYFVQLSDLHLGTKKTNEGVEVLNESLDELYQHLHSQHQIKYLITGDLMNSPNRKNMYLASQFMNRLKKQYHGDVTFVLGNHDVIVHGLNIFKKQKAKVVAYLLGENIKVLEQEKIIIIKIDSTSEGNLARGKVGKIKLDEIEEELASIENLDQYTLIAMMHHHLIPIKKDDFLKIKWNEKLFMGKLMDSSKALVDAKEVIEWLDGHGVDYVFHGHKHIPYVGLLNSMYIIAGGSSCGGGAKESKSRYLSYNVLKYDYSINRFKYCFIFYDDLTKQERHRVKVNFLGGNYETS